MDNILNEEPPLWAYLILMVMLGFILGMIHEQRKNRIESMEDDIRELKGKS